MDELEYAITTGDATNPREGTLKLGIRGMGNTRTGGWVAYDDAEAAFGDMGFGFSIPSEVYGQVPTDFLVIDAGFRRCLSIGYREGSRKAGEVRHMSSRPIAIVQKSRDGMPPGVRTDTSQNRHNIEMSGHVVTVCGNGGVTTARWKMTDPDTGLTWHYYATVEMPLSDEDLLGLIRQFDEDLVWNRPKSVM